MTEHAFNEFDWKFNMGEGYIFFQVTEPEELSYTFKLHPAPFAMPWVN